MQKFDKSSPLNRLNNQGGNAILIAMIASSVLGVMLFVATQQSQNTDKVLKTSRLKNIFYRQEQVAKHVIDQISHLNCSDVTTSNQSTNIEDCKVDMNYLKQIIEYPINGCIQDEIKYPKSIAQCGVIIDPQDVTSFDGIKLKNLPSMKLQIYLVYSGKDTPSMTNAKRKIERTFSLIKAGTPGVVGCFDANKPFLVKIENGQAVCRSISSEKNCGMDAPQNGKYLFQVNMNGLDYFKANCRSLVSSQSCSNDQVISSYHWNGSDNFTVNCKALNDPFVNWPNR